MLFFEKTGVYFAQTLVPQPHGRRSQDLVSYRTWTERRPVTYTVVTIANAFMNLNKSALNLYICSGQRRGSNICKRRRDTATTIIVLLVISA